MSSNSRIQSIDLLRGFAALAVAWFHIYTQNSVGGSPAHDISVIDRLSAWGRWGVQLFFVISGFVIAYTLQDRPKFDRWTDWPLYFARRIVRLDILYFAVLLLYILFAPYLAGMKSEGFPINIPHERPVEFTQWVKNIFYFLPIQERLQIPVAWTLAIEVQFYLFYSGIVILLNYYAKPKLLPRIVFGITIFSMLYPLGFFTTPIGFWLLPSLANLLGGSMIFFLWHRKCKETIAYNLTYLALLCAAFLKEGSSSVLSVIIGYLSLLIVLFWMPKQIASLRIFTLLGASSYAIYMTHSLVGSVTTSRLSLLLSPTPSNRLLVVGAGIFITVVVSYFLHLWVERPAISLSKKIQRK